MGFIYTILSVQIVDVWINFIKCTLVIGGETINIDCFGSVSLCFDSTIHFVSFPVVESPRFCKLSCLWLCTLKLNWSLYVGQLPAVFVPLLNHPSYAPSSLDVMHSCTRANGVAVRISYIVMEHMCQSNSVVLNYNSQSNH